MANGAAQSVSECEEWVRRSKNLLNEVNDLVEAEDRHLLSKTKQFAIPNFEEEAEIDLVAVRTERLQLKSEMQSLEAEMESYLKELGYGA